MSRFPNVFLVGAPRCGTTALFRYLAAHPDVFGPAQKELYHFGRDLVAPHALARPDREARYLAHYAGWADERVALDGTPWSLFSETAAAEIAAAVPAARIVAMVRDPAEMLPSLHGIFQVSRDPYPAGVLREDGVSVMPLDEALATADDRRRELAARVAAEEPGHNALLLFHPDVCGYTAQIRRYLEVFGPERVFVIPFDRFRAATAATYREVLGFLSLDPSFAPDFVPQNANRRVRSQRLARILRTGDTLPVARRAVKALVPERARKSLARRLIHANLQQAPREPVRPETAAALRSEFYDEVGALGELLGEDLLTRWGYRDA